MNYNFSSVRIHERKFKQDPYGFYAWMRAEAPIGKVRMPLVKEAWIVARYADVAALLKDPRLAKDRANAPPPPGLPARPPLQRLFAPLMNGMLDKDDPDHTRLRRLAQAAFTPKRVALLTDHIAAISEELIHRLKGRAQFDLIADYALPLPVIVISRLLGVPAADQARFIRGSKALINVAQSPLAAVVGVPRILGFMHFIRGLIAARRATPRDDLISALVEAQADGAVLNDDELLSMVILLLTAGHETTTNLIGNGMVALMAHPAEADRLRAEPSLIDSAVEELLRFAPPVETSTLRYAREDLAVAGTTIRRGEAVVGLIGSANRDAAQFADPDRLDLTRAANRHLTFGMGGHYCLGAPLARLEGRIALPALLTAFPTLRSLTPTGNLAWRPGLILRGLERLPACVWGRGQLMQSSAGHQVPPFVARGQPLIWTPVQFLNIFKRGCGLTTMDLKRRFGQAVKSTRRQKGFSQEDLAVRIGADQAYISRIEAGQVNITLDTLELIASALGVEAVVLIPSSKV